MNCTYIAICSEEYLPYYRELYKSIKEHSPNSEQILYYIGDKIPNPFLESFIKGDVVKDITDWFNNCNPNYTTLEKICSLRAKVVLNAFENWGANKVIFCGAKLKFFNQPRELERLLHDGYNAVVTPHITSPLPEDGKFPSNASVSFTGHISTDLVAFRNTSKIVKFLKWQDNVMKTQCKTTHQTYLDQSWLNFLPFFVNDVKILRNPGYNVAYWNYKQRFLRKSSDGKDWFVSGDGLGEILTCFQFSGLDINNPECISTHQNREVAEGDFLEFLKDYAEKVK